MYFNEGQAERDEIKKCDVDVSKLKLSRKDLRIFLGREGDFFKGS